MPNLTEMPEGCAFHPRCELAEGECFTTVPELMKRGNFRRLAACHKV
jgi:oligopeptide/dipeptide ABC transporter ATP-binding protein